MKLNVVSRSPAPRTAMGAVAHRTTAEQTLMRSVMACMLWEKNAYSSGKSVADTIAETVPQVSPEFAAAVAYHARTDMKLRHVPLLVVREMVRHPEHKKLVGKLLPDVIQRPDEITEFLKIYWKDAPGSPIAKQVKKGLAAAFDKFSEYQLAKWDRAGEVRLRDVMFLVHAKPKDATTPGKYTKAERQAERASSQMHRDLSYRESLFRRVVDSSLAVPDTWEVALSAGADKKETWTTLLMGKKLGAQAFLMNLRNMDQAGVDRGLIKDYAENVPVERILPFQFLSSARAMPKYEDIIEPMMFRCLEDTPKLSGRTVLILDVSGSMGARISGKSDLTRVDTAAALAALVREQCEEAAIYATAGSDGSRVHKTAALAPRRGFALIEAVRMSFDSLGGGGIFLKQCMDYVLRAEEGNRVDRVIVLTDEQDCDTKANPSTARIFDGKPAYLINVATERHGIGYGKWTHIDGWSERVLDYIDAYEMQNQ